MCTILYASDRKIALGGNNEDYTNAQTKVWFVPTEGGEIDGTPFRPGYGRVYFGHDEWHIQGGMNDQGLFFDMVAVQPAYVPKFGINGSEFKGSLQDVFMAECASVEEVLAYVSGLTFVEKWAVGILVGDKTGASQC